MNTETGNSSPRSIAEVEDFLCRLAPLQLWASTVERDPLTTG